MSSLKKRRKTWFIRFQKTVNGRKVEITKSLQTHNKAVALKRKQDIDEKIKYERLNPFDPDFELIFEEPKPDLLFVRETIGLFLQSRERCRQATQDYYDLLLHHFESKLHIEKKLISTISKRHFERFLLRDGIRNSTRRSERKGLRTWWLFCKKKGWVEQDILKEIELPTAEVQYFPKMLTEKELKLLFKTFDEHIEERKQGKNFSPWQTQDWFKPAIATMFYTGIRRREIGTVDHVKNSGLRGKNIIDNLDFIYIGKSKTPKERMIPISRKLKPYLLAYFEIRGWPKADEYVFINYKKQPVTGKNMWRQFKRYCKMAGIPDTRTLHGMRHRCITTWIEDGFTLSEAKDMAGHTHIEITDSVYTHLAAKNLKRKMDKLESNKDK